MNGQAVLLGLWTNARLFRAVYRGIAAITADRRQIQASDVACLPALTGSADVWLGAGTCSASPAFFSPRATARGGVGSSKAPVRLWFLLRGLAFFAGQQRENTDRSHKIGVGGDRLRITCIIHSLSLLLGC